MGEGMTIEHAPSTNGRVYPERPPAAASGEAPAGTAPARSRRARILVPVALVVAALVVLRRMQRGSYA